MSDMMMTMLVTLLLTIVLGIALAVLLLPSIFGKAPRRQVLLLGHAGAGKTTLFAALRLGAGGGGPEMRGATLVSTAPNVAPLENVGDVDLVDVPGHPRLRLAMLERSSLWRKVVAIVFVVDSVNLMKEARETGELLFEVLTHKQLQGRGEMPPMLIACTKSDKVTAYSADFVRKRLEKELNSVRGSRASALRDTDGSSGSAAMKSLGKSDDEPYAFPEEVRATSVSVLKNANIDAVRDFIGTAVPPQ